MLDIKCARYENYIYLLKYKILVKVTLGCSINFENSLSDLSFQKTDFLIRLS